MTTRVTAVLEAASAVLKKAQQALDSLVVEETLLKTDAYGSGAQARAIAHAETIAAEVAKLRKAIDRLTP